MWLTYSMRQCLAASVCSFQSCSLSWMHCLKQRHQHVEMPHCSVIRWAGQIARILDPASSSTKPRIIQAIAVVMYFRYVNIHVTKQHPAHVEAALPKMPAKRTWFVPSHSCICAHLHSCRLQYILNFSLPRTNANLQSILPFGLDNVKRKNQSRISIIHIHCYVLLVWTKDVLFSVWQLT